MCCSFCAVVTVFTVIGKSKKKEIHMLERGKTLFIMKTPGKIKECWWNDWRRKQRSMSKTESLFIKIGNCHKRGRDSRLGSALTVIKIKRWWVGLRGCLPWLSGFWIRWSLPTLLCWHVLILSLKGLDQESTHCYHYLIFCVKRIFIAWDKRKNYAKIWA